MPAYYTNTVLSWNITRTEYSVNSYSQPLVNCSYNSIETKCTLPIPYLTDYRVLLINYPGIVDVYWHRVSINYNPRPGPYCVGGTRKPSLLHSMYLWLLRVHVSVAYVLWGRTTNILIWKGIKLIVLMMTTTINHLQLLVTIVLQVLFQLLYAWPLPLVNYPAQTMPQLFLLPTLLHILNQILSWLPTILLRTRPQSSQDHTATTTLPTPLLSTITATLKVYNFQQGHSYSTHLIVSGISLETLVLMEELVCFIKFLYISKPTAL